MESDDSWIELVNELALINDRIGRLDVIEVSIDDEGAVHIEGSSPRDGVHLIVTIPSIEIEWPDGRTTPLTPDILDLDGLGGSTLLGVATPDGVLRVWHADGSIWSSVERNGYSDLWGISVQNKDGHYIEWAEGAPMFVGLA